ncbi:Asp-tRNA(Asn)/Glu-tRNA(Gln) amidotransferase subunit GatA [archaeon]|nr:MAG: Asp-tRNA(Asn)/Glu-tRNA(Gln) amidotransferase subunit GatA [archaeon]
MNYNISVREFLEKAKAGDIDFADFSAKVAKEAERLNRKLNCFITINNEFAKNAKSAQPAKGKSLLYLPISIKDNICTRGLASTAGSKILHNYVPPFDATSVARIKKEGGQVLGKTSMDEFGFGGFSVNVGVGFKIPKNPFDSERSAGGSSGGAGAIAAAANFTHIALAESTGGSISAPASFCGVVGLTPTYGLVSRYGLIDYANSLDKIGCIGKSVYDCSLLLSAIAGHDEKDSTSLHEKQQNYTKYCDEGKKMKIAVPKEYFQNIGAEVEKEVWKAIKLLEKEGYSYEQVSLPSTKYAVSAYYIIAMSEASTNLAKYCGMRYGFAKPLEGNFNEYFSSVRAEGFGVEAKRRIILGTYARMAGYRDAFYMKALKIRTLIIQDFKKVFKKFDAIAAPTMPMLPPKFSEIERLSPLENYQADILTVPANLAGIPHISVPCGLAKGLPVGLHLLADHLQEGKIISLGSQYEEIRGGIKYPKV